MERTIILKNTDTGQTLTLPVTPSSYPMSAGRAVERLDMAQTGQIALPGLQTLFTGQLEFFLPAKRYPFLTSGAVTDPQYYIDLLTAWGRDANVCRYIVTGTGVNIPVLLGPLDYGENDGTNDVTCKLPLYEYRYLEEAKTEQVTQNAGRPVDADSQPQTADSYTVAAGDSLGTTIDVTAYDRGLYLTRNSAFLRVEGQTAEAVTASLCAQFGIPVGSLAATGVPLTRNFLGVALYKIIMTLYTLAADQTGKKYRIRFRGRQLEVVEVAVSPESLRLKPGCNLLSCVTRESASAMTNSDYNGVTGPVSGPVTTPHGAGTGALERFTGGEIHSPDTTIDEATVEQLEIDLEVGDQVLLLTEDDQVFYIVMKVVDAV